MRLLVPTLADLSLAIDLILILTARNFNFDSSFAFLGVVDLSGNNIHRKNVKENVSRRLNVSLRHGSWWLASSL